MRYLAGEAAGLALAAGEAAGLALVSGEATGDDAGVAAGAGAEFGTGLLLTTEL